MNLGLSSASLQPRLIIKGQNSCSSSIEKTLSQVIMLSNSNRELKMSQQPIKEMPMVIFVTGVDIPNNIYRISSLPLSYPVMTINNELKVDKENLKISI